MAAVFQQIAHSSSLDVGDSGQAEVANEVPVQARRDWNVDQVVEAYDEWAPKGVRSNVVSPGLVRTALSEAFYQAPGVLEALLQQVERHPPPHERGVHQGEGRHPYQQRHSYPNPYV